MSRDPKGGVLGMGGQGKDTLGVGVPRNEGGRASRSSSRNWSQPALW